MRSSRVAFLLVILVSCIITCGSPDAGGRRALTPAASITPTPAATPTGVPRPTLPPTRRPATPQPSPTAALATSAATELRPPMVIDSEAGRLYLTGVVDGSEQIVALAATDGRLLATYGLTGTFDVDPAHGWLYVDQAETGLVVLDVPTGTLHTVISLPADSNWWRRSDRAPQADPATGYVLAFRGNVVHVIDPAQGRVVDAIAFDIPARFGGQSGGQARLQWAVYDSDRHLLYLDFKTAYNLSFWVPDNDTIISYDLDADTEIDRVVVGPAIRATTFDGRLCGADWWNAWSHWIWQDGKPYRESGFWWHQGDWDDQTGFYVDSTRGLLYESSGGFRVFNAETMTLLMSRPSPVEGRLVGYDPKTDQLYFLSSGFLYIWPAGAIRPPSPEPLEASQPPTRSVQHLFVSPAWPQDRTLFGSWGYDNAGCGSAVRFGSLLYISNDGGSTWGRPRGGLRGTCGRISALAVSPDYARDRTIFAGVVGMGVFKSTDGGQLWQPSSAGLSDMCFWQILLSPAYEHDRTVFVNNCGSDFRSLDGGATWQPLGVGLDWMAISPEFDQDRILMGTAFFSGTKILISRDGGTTWDQTGDMPGIFQPQMLSIAPMFSKHQVVFTYIHDTLYRSVDGGHHWEAVLSSVRDGYPPPQLVYGSETENGNPLFLLVTGLQWNEDIGTFRQSALYRSEDGVSWQEIELPPDIVPSALAISPAFAEDELLFVGTEDGRVVAFRDGDWETVVLR